MIASFLPPALMITIERELDLLFQAPFAEFVGTRNALATRLKKEGRDAESTRVRGLAKPTYTSWLVNQLYWGARRELEAFLKAADRVRAADKAALEGKRPGGGDAATERTQALDALLSRASSRAAEEGTPLSPALAERLRTTLDAIGAHGSAAARHARGRLQEDLDPPGFAAFAALVASAGPAARKPAPPPAPVPVLVRPAANPRVSDARAKLADAQAEAARRQDAASAAADAERRARTAADLAKSRRIESERALKSAAAEEEAATSALRARQAESRAAAQAAAVAERALEKAKAALAKLT
jgi:hypothetical protein